MAKEFFAFPETRQLFSTLEDICHRSGVSRGKAFEDVIRASVAALAAETMESEYFEAIEAHTAGDNGKRGVDLIPKFFAQAVSAMSHRDNDVLGDLFQGAISYGENGLYLTPQPIAEMMARVSIDVQEKTSDGQKPVIADPCCGTGILLMESGRINPRAELVGQDIDARCARIAAINLGLRQKYGWIICGNTLSREVRFVYRIGSFFHEGPNGLRRGVIRSVPPEQCPVLPELGNRTHRDLLDAIEDNPPVDPAPQPERPTIIEIPDWMIRMEHQLASLEPVQLPEQPDTDSPKQKDAIEPDDDRPAKQRRLF